MLVRIKQYIDFKKITVARFEAEIGMSNNSFRKSLRNNGSIGTDKLENILKHFPDINPQWLLTGEGAMLRSAGSDNFAQAAKAESQPEPVATVDYKEKYIMRLEEVVDVLHAQVGEQQMQVNDQRMQVNDQRLQVSDQRVIINEFLGGRLVYQAT